MQRALLVLPVLLCAACAANTTRRPSTNPELPPGAVAATPAPAPPRQTSTQQQAGLAVANAAAFVNQTRVMLPAWTAADTDIAAARDALRNANWDAARAHAAEASAQADAALSDHYTRLAHEELRRAYNYTGLDDGQLALLNVAEETLVTGNSRLAYGRLRMLNRQLAQRIKTYTVAAGESLWVIAGKAQVYGNPLLWPLIWRDNIAVIPKPSQLRRGQVLKLRPHPTLDEVVEAVQEARGKRAARPTVTPSIGQIRTAE